MGDNTFYISLLPGNDKRENRCQENDQKNIIYNCFPWSATERNYS